MTTTFMGRTTSAVHWCFRALAHAVQCLLTATVNLRCTALRIVTWFHNTMQCNNNATGGCIIYSAVSYEKKPVSTADIRAKVRNHTGRWGVVAPPELEWRFRWIFIRNGRPCKQQGWKNKTGRKVIREKRRLVKTSCMRAEVGSAKLETNVSSILTVAWR